MQQDFQDLLSPMFHGQATPDTIHRKVVIVVASQNVHKP